MGQKVNPHGLRVGVIKDWDSKWYAEADFADNLVEDYKIRKYLIFEEADETHTRVYGNSEACVYEGQFWSLDNFLKIW